MNRSCYLSLCSIASLLLLLVCGKCLCPKLMRIIVILCTWALVCNLAMLSFQVFHKHVGKSNQEPKSSGRDRRLFFSRGKNQKGRSLRWIIPFVSLCSHFLPDNVIRKTEWFFHTYYSLVASICSRFRWVVRKQAKKFHLFSRCGHVYSAEWNAVICN